MLVPNSPVPCMRLPVWIWSSLSSLGTRHCWPATPPRMQEWPLSSRLPLADLSRASKLEVGSVTPSYQLPFSQYGFLLTNCWLKTLWKFLSSANLTLQSCKNSGLHLQQTNDTCLMDYLVSLSAFMPTFLQSLNCCCLQMQCYSLANVSTVDGCHLHPPFFFQHSPRPPSTLIWPVEHLSPADLALWHDTLSWIFCSSGHTLLTPLGPWLLSPHCIGAYMKYDPLADSLYLPGN